LTQKVTLSLGSWPTGRVWAVEPCRAGGAWHAQHLLLRAPRRDGANRHRGGFVAAPLPRH